MTASWRRKLTVCALLLTTAAFGEARKENTAVVAQPRTDKMWVDRNAEFNAKVKKANPELLFIGDSITHAWESDGKNVWSKYYAPRKAFNLGIGGDRTQHVLYRLENGNVDGIHPKLAVLMIGTNNSSQNDYTAEEIAEGVKAVVEKLGQKLPKTKVLVLGVFPRGHTPGPQRGKIAELNRKIAKLADGKRVYFLDIGIHFLQADKTISPDIMPDYLHLSARGYEIWATAIEGTLRTLLGEEPCSW